VTALETLLHFCHKISLLKTKNSEISRFLGEFQLIQSIQGSNDNDICHDKTCNSLTNSDSYRYFLHNKFLKIVSTPFCLRKIQFQKDFILKRVSYQTNLIQERIFLFSKHKNFSRISLSTNPQRNKEINFPQVESWFDGQS